MTALEHYLSDVSVIRPMAVRETSYYPALAALLDRLGGTLTPRVKCVVHAHSVGSGIPDLGLFTWDQLTRSQGNAMARGIKPARGVVEAKGTNTRLEQIVRSEQVGNYLEGYGQVLVTNLREFVLVVRDDQGRTHIEEGFQLAATEPEFWALAARSDDLDEATAKQFEQYLRRVMMRGAPLTSPEDVALVLASYARDALTRIEHSALPGLRAVRQALEDALGLPFEGEEGDHFFRSTLVQTLFYGLFSAWVLWSEQAPRLPGDRFDWRTTLYHLQVPVIRALYQQVSSPSTLGPLGLMELLNLAAEALNRVDRDAFFTRFQQGRAVQYFYEPFLEQFDPQLRKDLGVWYTPPEVVEYMVGRVDAALRTELGIPDGLADQRVHILDPCTGTGSYLVEILKRIERTLRERGEDALVGYYLKQAARSRLHGFEILPAPLVVAHLQLGLLLQRLGAPLDEQSERASVILTNSLTGWETDVAARQETLFPELQEERDAAATVKRDAPILVVLGNPPYNGFAGRVPEAEGAMTNAYRRAVSTLQPEGQGLNDLYVRFYRMAERRIVEQTRAGIVCLISNYSWLDGRSFTAMRERYLDVFDSISVDRLNGDRFKTGKLTPDGNPDPSIFSTERDREGIQVGTAIALLVRQHKHVPTRTVRFRDLWGEGKRAQLRAEAGVQTRSLHYVEVSPDPDLGLPFAPMTLDSSYLQWPTLPALLPQHYPGVNTSRDDFVTDIDRDRLEERITRYLDPRLSHEEARRLFPSAMQARGRFDPQRVRDRLRARGYQPGQVVRYLYRPFDPRWLYWEPQEQLLDRPREDYAAQTFEGNLWLSANQRNRKEEYYQPQVTSLLTDYHLVESNVTMFPRATISQQARLGSSDTSPQPIRNLSDAARLYLARLGVPDDSLFFHALAIIHSPSYIFVNSGALRQDWPRVPLPANRDALVASADLGRRLSALLDPLAAVPGVTTGLLREELRKIAIATKEGGGQIDPGGGDLLLTLNWGYRTPRGAVMPGSGRAIEREFRDDERRAINRAGNPLGLETAGDDPLGASTYDVYLNGWVCWRNVPGRVWDYSLGGYRNVLKKWLSYREDEVLGRPMQVFELNEFSNIARRIAAILLLQPSLDANYRNASTETYDWATSRTVAEQVGLW